jgi:DNA-binding transcriptional regulator YiaG
MGQVPTAAQVKELRGALNLDHTEFAKLVYCARQSAYQWEAGLRRMHPAVWELLRIKAQKLLPFGELP